MMPQELSDEQRSRLESRLTMMKKLLALPSVAKHETRFENEVALVAPSSALADVAAIVEAQMGAALKPAGAPVPTDFTMARVFGGLRRDQTLYVQALGSGLSMYVAFWPWGGGKRFTIKLGVHEG